MEDSYDTSSLNTTDSSVFSPPLSDKPRRPGPSQGNDPTYTRPSPFAAGVQVTELKNIASDFSRTSLYSEESRATAEGVEFDVDSYVSHSDGDRAPDNLGRNASVTYESNRLESEEFENISVSHLMDSSKPQSTSSVSDSLHLGKDFKDSKDKSIKSLSDISEEEGVSVMTGSNEHNKVESGENKFCKGEKSTQVSTKSTTKSEVNECLLGEKVQGQYGAGQGHSDHGQGDRVQHRTFQGHGNQGNGDRVQSQHGTSKGHSGNGQDDEDHVFKQEEAEDDWQTTDESLVGRQ